MSFLLALAVLLGPAAPAFAVAPAASARPEWVAPLDGPLDVRRPFAPPATKWGSGHRGVDLAAYEGDVVRAAGAGTVTYAGALAERGVLVVRHGTLRTTYEPVTPLVDAGTEVEAGEPVALLDSGHATTSPPDALLHWGLLRGDTYLDPLRLLRRGPSRLVPVPPADPADPAPPPDARAAPAAPLAIPPRTAEPDRRSGDAAVAALVATGAPALVLGAAAWGRRPRRGSARASP